MEVDHMVSLDARTLAIVVAEQDAVPDVAV